MWKERLKKHFALCETEGAFVASVSGGNFGNSSFGVHFSRTRGWPRTVYDTDGGHEDAEFVPHGAKVEVVLIFLK